MFLCRETPFIWVSGKWPWKKIAPRIIDLRTIGPWMIAPDDNYPRGKLLSG